MYEGGNHYVWGGMGNCIRDKVMYTAVVVVEYYVE
jgi:hypothetical protein